MPFLKPGIEEMLSQMPPEMKISFFALKVVEFQGEKGSELFEVSSRKLKSKASGAEGADPDHQVIDKMDLKSLPE